MSTLDRWQARRASWLLRCYPRLWRARYGEEFTALLSEELAERPRSPTLMLDVIRCGLLARMNAAGLAGHSRDAERQTRAALAVLGCAAALFMAVALALWSQLTIGWQWAAPDAAATKLAMVVMSASVLALLLVAILAALPVVLALCRRLAGDHRGRLAGPLLLLAAGAVVLVVGSLHFEHGWPGTGGHPWPERGLVPAGVARFCWAATLWISSYWAHPAALASFPLSQLAWMLVTPAAYLLVGTGAARTLRELSLSARALRFQTRLGVVAAAAMTALLAGAGSWVVSGGPAPDRLFAVGLIDIAGLAVMAAALVCAVRALECVRLAGQGRVTTL